MTGGGVAGHGDSSFNLFDLKDLGFVFVFLDLNVKILNFTKT